MKRAGRNQMKDHSKQNSKAGPTKYKNIWLPLGVILMQQRLCLQTPTLVIYALLEIENEHWTPCFMSKTPFKLVCIQQTCQVIHTESSYHGKEFLYNQIYTCMKTIRQSTSLPDTTYREDRVLVLWCPLEAHWQTEFVRFAEI